MPFVVWGMWVLLRRTRFGLRLAAMFFSLVGVAGIRLQLLFGASIPHDVLLSLPYLATILGVWISGRMRGGARATTEASELRDY